MFVVKYIVIDCAITGKSHLVHCKIKVDTYEALLIFGSSASTNCTSEFRKNNIINNPNLKKVTLFATKIALK